MSSQSALWGMWSTNNDAEVAAQASVDNSRIMGMNMLEAAKIRSGDLQFAVSSQQTIAMAQIEQMGMMDARQAANERRALRNELRYATLQYSAEIKKIGHEHVENMKELDNQAEEIEFKMLALSKEGDYWDPQNAMV